MFIYILKVLTFFVLSTVFVRAELPPIYISNNSFNEKLYSTNIETVNFSRKKNVSFFASNVLKNSLASQISNIGGAGSMSQLRLRGSEANHTLVLIDGMRVNDPATGSEYSFDHLLGSQIDSIDIISGGYSVVHGSDALAGVVNIKTKKENMIRMHTGSNNSLLNSYSHIFNLKNIQFSFGANSFKTSGNDTSGLVSTDRNRYENDTFNFSSSYKNNNFKLRYSSIYRQNDSDKSGNLINTELDITKIYRIFSKFSNKNKFYSLENVNYIDYARTKNRDWNHLGSWESTTLSERFNLKSILSKEFDNTFLNFSPKVSLLAEYEKINFQQQGSDHTYGNPDQIQSQNSKSLAIELLFPFKFVNFELLMRRNYNQKFENKSNVRFGTVFPINNGKFFLSYSTAIKNPSFTERFGFYSETFVGNPNLQPEISISHELGFSKSFNQNFNITSSFFYSILKDEINGSYYDSGLGAFTARNKERNSYRRGFENKLSYSAKYYNFDIKHSFVDATEYNSSVKSQVREIRRPKNIININFDFEIPKFNTFVDLNYRYQSVTEDIDFSVYPSVKYRLKDFGTLNLYAEKLINNKLSIVLSVNNLFNKKAYDVYGYKLPGIEGSFGINYQY